MKRSFLFLALFGILLISTTGCYNYRVMVKNPDPATDYSEKKVLHSLFWGAIQKKLVADECMANTIDEVRFKSNPGFALITVVTLGIWSPITVQYRCSKPCEF